MQFVRNKILQEIPLLHYIIEVTQASHRHTILHSFLIAIIHNLYTLNKSHSKWRINFLLYVETA